MCLMGLVMRRKIENAKDVAKAVSDADKILKSKNSIYIIATYKSSIPQDVLQEDLTKYRIYDVCRYYDLVRLNISYLTL